MESVTKDAASLLLLSTSSFSSSPSSMTMFSQEGNIPSSTFSLTQIPGGLDDQDKQDRDGNGSEDKKANDFSYVTTRIFILPSPFSLACFLSLAFSLLLAFSVSLAFWVLLAHHFNVESLAFDATREKSKKSCMSRFHAYAKPLLPPSFH